MSEQYVQDGSWSGTSSLFSYRLSESLVISTAGHVEGLDAGRELVKENGLQKEASAHERGRT